MKFICPSCGVTNRCPDKAAGLVLICRRCKTQATVPAPPDGARPRLWSVSRRWLAVAAAEVVILAVGAAVGYGLWGSRGSDDPLPLAVPGRTFEWVWRTDVETPGGHFRVVSHSVVLAQDPQPALPLAARPARARPWGGRALRASRLPASEPVELAFDVDLSVGERLYGKTVVLRATAEIEHPARSSDGASVEVRRRKIVHEQPLALATEEQRDAMDRHTLVRTLLRVGIGICAVAFVAVAVAAVATAQQRVKIMCPECGRATIATFYHEAGELLLTDCPHTGSSETTQQE